MTILVTGAAGFLGSHLTALLAGRGGQTRALVHPRGTRAGRRRPASMSTPPTSPTGLPSPPPWTGWTACSIARRGPARGDPPAEYHRVNVAGLETMVRAAMAAGVRRFVHVSSITVHGNDVHGAADENSPLRSEPNPYSQTKVAGELLLRRMIRDEGAPVTIIRPGWIYGPGDTASFGRFATMIADGRMIVIGAGRNHIPLAYVGDVAEGMLLAAAAEQAAGRAYLLLNDEPVTQHEFLAAIAAELGAAAAAAIPYRAGVLAGGVAEMAWKLARREQAPPVMRYGLQLLGGENRFSIARARHELGFSPVVGYAEGVRRGIAWYREARGRPGRPWQHRRGARS